MIVYPVFEMLCLVETWNIFHCSGGDRYYYLCFVDALKEMIGTRMMFRSHFDVMFVVVE